MRAKTGTFRRPLGQVFAAPSHLAVCRALLDTAEGTSGRQVARQAGINHQTCAVALGRLEELGVVRRQGSGQSQLFQLSRENLLVRDLLIPLLRKEREVFPRVLRRVGELTTGRCVRALVFGSVARSEERRESDLDLLLIADGSRGQASTRQAANEVRAVLGKEWGLRVNAIVLTQRTVEVRRQRRDPLIANILREGIEVALDRKKDRDSAPARAKTTG
jgi:predicted nucleotidyltransferase